MLKEHKDFSRTREHAWERYSASPLQFDREFSPGGFISIEEKEISCVTLPFSQAFSTYGTILTKTFAEDVRLENDPYFLFSLSKHCDGFFIYVPPNIHIESLSLVHRTKEEDTSALARVHIVLGKNASLNLYETFATHNASLCVAHMTCELEAGSRLILHSFAQHSGRIMTSYRTLLKEDSSCIFTCAQEAPFSKSTFRCSLQGCGASLSYTDFSHVTSNTKSDRFSLVEHTAPKTISQKVVKRIIENGGDSQYTGKIVIEREGIGSQAKQMHRALTLGPQALCKASPIFNIFQSEAQATHGSIIAPFNEELLFYARTRGLSVDDARSFMLKAFCDDTLKAFPESTRTFLERRLT